MTVPLSRQFLTDPMDCSSQFKLLKMVGVTSFCPVFFEATQDRVLRAIEINDSGYIPKMASAVSSEHPFLSIHREGSRVLALDISEKGTLWERLFPAPISWVERHLKGEMPSLVIGPETFREPLTALCGAFSDLNNLCRTQEINVIDFSMGDLRLGLVLQYHRGYCVRVGTYADGLFSLPQEIQERSARWHLALEPKPHESLMKTLCEGILQHCQGPVGQKPLDSREVIKLL